MIKKWKKNKIALLNEDKYQWIQVTDNSTFATRDGASALVFKDSLWLIGGWNPLNKKNFSRICNNEVWNSAVGSHYSNSEGFFIPIICGFVFSAFFLSYPLAKLAHISDLISRRMCLPLWL
ncbi:MAG: hypothetical protein GDA37_00980 [Ekhidna sp.]|nr:hypothetical protein [Ekhidna sp.]